MKEGEVESGGGCDLHTSKYDPSRGRKKRVGIHPSELPQDIPRKLGPFSENFESKATVLDRKTPSGIPRVLAVKTTFPLDLIILLQGLYQSTESEVDCASQTCVTSLSIL